MRDKPKRPDLQAVLEHYGVYVSHSGMAKCVFHSEDDPSMSVNLDKGLVNCHACGEGGDAWTVIMLREGLSFADAVQWSRRQGFREEEGSDVESASRTGTGRLGRRAGRSGGRWRPSWRA